ncbi:MAG: response regulator [Mycobacteriales bacterium]|nr:response regulator [Mycobacteriales bacterium]
MTHLAACAARTLTSLSGRRTVLVVDDEESVRELLAVVLTLEGHQVVQAADGPTALALAATVRPDLVVLDVMMPGMDGWEVAARLAAHPATAGVPRMVVSGKPLGELEGAVGRDLVATVLTKPFDFVVFVDQVRTLLDSACVPAPRSAAADAVPSAAQA